MSSPSACPSPSGSPDPSPYTSLGEPLLCHPLTSSGVTNSPPQPRPGGHQNARLPVLKPIKFQDMTGQAATGQASGPPPLLGSLSPRITPAPRQNALLTQSHRSIGGGSAVRWGLQSKGLISPWREGSLAPKLLTEQQLTRRSQTLLLSKTYLGSSHPPFCCPPSPSRPKEQL